MKLLSCCALVGALAAASAFAALPDGHAAPDFTTQASLAGKPFTFSLAAALQERAGGALLLPRRLHARLHGGSP